MSKAHERDRSSRYMRALVLEDDDSLASAYSRILTTLDYEVVQVGTVAEARTAIRNHAPDLVLVDIDLPDGNGLNLMEELRNDVRGRFLVISGDASQRALVKSIRHRAVELIRKPIRLDELRARLTVIKAEASVSVNALHQDADCWIYHGDNPALKSLRTAMSYCAERSRGHALILGDAGVEKPTIAVALHHRGRRHGACVVVDCSVNHGNTEFVRFFGQEDAETGTVTHSGYLEQAAAGTLVLDYVEHLSDQLQSRLLPFLTSGRFKRINGKTAVEATVSVVGIARRGSTADVDESDLKSDFLIRLAQHVLAVPNLKQCRDDLIRIADYLLMQASVQRLDSPRLSLASRDFVSGFAWDNNVRQLRSVIERTLATTAPEHLVEIDRQCCAETVATEESDIAPWVGTTIWEMERQLLIATLDSFDGNKDRTAQALGISLKTLYNRINSYSTP